MIVSIRKYLFVIFGILFITGCQGDEQCRKENIVQMRMVFLDIETNKTYNADSITIQGVGNDSILYNNRKSISSIELPLHKTQERTQFAISSGDLKDTITLCHTNHDTFISLECGCFVYHTLNKVWSNHTWIDSISIINPEITASSEDEHLQIFFH